MPPEEGNGFLFAQGVHVEIMGQGRASRLEIEGIAKYLPWGEIGRKPGNGSSPVPGIGPGSK
jgi:hypothetical protein